MAKKQTGAIDARHYDVVLAPHITEKSTLASEHNAVVFKVAGSASKPQIKEAIEAIFDRKVSAVNTIVFHYALRQHRAVSCSSADHSVNAGDSGDLCVPRVCSPDVRTAGRF